jgi:asparaginyl-tRNA synthetase
VRESKTVAFLELADGSALHTAQLVAEADLPCFAALPGAGSAVRCLGAVALTPDRPRPYEIKLRELTLEGESPPDYPLQKKRHSMEFLREIAHLRPRANTFQAVFRIRSEAAFAVHEFFRERRFVYLHSPIITAGNAEGAGEMFRVTVLPPGESDYSKDFFGTRAGLAVTGQLEAEVFAQAFGKVYTFGPTFRAENSNTPRHAAEFWMIEPEVAFADLADNMALAEDMLKYTVNRVLPRCEAELDFLSRHVCEGLWEKLRAFVSAPFAKMTYADAMTELMKARGVFALPPRPGGDIATEHEKYLTENVAGGPVFVYDYPKDIKAFYMRQNDGGQTVAAMDLLVPGVGELAGGSQREERYDMLLRRMEELGLPRADFEWYLDLRRYGSATHSGFGVGFERLVMYLTGMQNIRDVLPFPRTPGNAGF